MVVLNTLIRKRWITPLLETKRMINNIQVLQVLKFGCFCSLQSFSTIVTIAASVVGDDTSCSSTCCVSTLLSWFSSQWLFSTHDLWQASSGRERHLVNKDRLLFLVFCILQLFTLSLEQWPQSVLAVENVPKASVLFRQQQDSLGDTESSQTAGSKWLTHSVHQSRYQNGVTFTTWVF